MRTKKIIGRFIGKVKGLLTYPMLRNDAQVIEELRTRVAEQEKLIEWHKKDTHDAMEWKNELQNRLSQAEEKEKELRENWLEDMKWTGYVSWVKAGSNGKDTIEKASVDGSSYREIVDYIEDFGEDMIIEVHIQRR